MSGWRWGQTDSNTFSLSLFYFHQDCHRPAFSLLGSPDWVRDSEVTPPQHNKQLVIKTDWMKMCRYCFYVSTFGLDFKKRKKKKATSCLGSVKHRRWNVFLKSRYQLWGLSWTLTEQSQETEASHLHSKERTNSEVHRVEMFCSALTGCSAFGVQHPSWMIQSDLPLSANKKVTNI